MEKPPRKLVFSSNHTSSDRIEYVYTEEEMGIHVTNLKKEETRVIDELEKIWSELPKTNG